MSEKENQEIVRRMRLRFINTHFNTFMYGEIYYSSEHLYLECFDKRIEIYMS